MNTKDKIKLIVIIIVSMLVTMLIPTGIYCIIEKQNPIAIVATVASSSEKRITGKWQNESRSSAYKFNEDGTYESYFSTFSYTGKYTIKGDKLTLSNPASNSTVVYRVKVDKESLTMTPIMEGGLELDESQETTAEFKKVERIEMKSISELLEALQQ